MGILDWLFDRYDREDEDWDPELQERWRRQEKEVERLRKEQDRIKRERRKEKGGFFDRHGETW